MPAFDQYRYRSRVAQRSNLTIPPSSKPADDCVPGTSRTGSLVDAALEEPMFPVGAELM
jgi:hypothetical protein